MDNKRIDVHQHVTDQLIAMLGKASGSVRLPWHRPGGNAMRPVNVATGKAYRGINILALWVRVVERWVPHSYQAFLDYRLGATSLSAPALKAMRRVVAGEIVTQETSGLPTREWNEIVETFRLNAKSV